MSLPTQCRTAWGQGLKAAFAWQNAFIAMHKAQLLCVTALDDTCRASGMEWWKLVFGPNQVEAEIEAGFRKLKALEVARGERA